MRVQHFRGDVLIEKGNGPHLAQADGRKRFALVQSLYAAVMGNARVVSLVGTWVLFQDDVPVLMICQFLS